MLIIPLRFARTGSSAPTLSSLIPEATREHGGADKFLRIPDVEEFVGSMLPRLNIEGVTRYLGDGSFGIIFEVELKPVVGLAAASQWHEVEEEQSLIGGITESKITHRNAAVLKIVSDSFDASHASPEIELLFRRLESLNQKIARSAQPDYGYEHMETRVKRFVANIREIIADLSNESPLKLKLSDKLSILDDIWEHSEGLPVQPKPREDMTEAERGAISRITDILASLDLDPLEDMGSDNDEKLALIAITDNLDYVLLALGEKYVLKKKDEQMIELVQSHLDSLPFETCDNYIKQNELSKIVNQVFGYIDIVKSISGFQPVCFATMKLAKADLSAPIEFLEDEYSSVQAGDEMFGEKVKARFEQFSEMVKDVLQGFFDLHLKGGVLHGDISVGNLLLVEEAGRLGIKINDFDLMKPLPTHIELTGLEKYKTGLAAIAFEFKGEARALLATMEKLLSLNAGQIGDYTLDDFEVTLDGHEFIEEPMTVRRLILAHFAYLQEKIDGGQDSQKLSSPDTRRII